MNMKMFRKCTPSTSFFVLMFLLCVLERGTVRSAPMEQAGSGSSSSSSVFDKYAGPVMVPVSSTVIPLLHLFGKPKPIKGSSQQQPRRLYLSPERRARLFERSNRPGPDAPVRLITKNSKGKDINNETH